MILLWAFGGIVISYHAIRKKQGTFPKRNIYILSFFGKAMVAERKVLSWESAGLSKKAKHR